MRALLIGVLVVAAALAVALWWQPGPPPPPPPSRAAAPAPLPPVGTLGQPRDDLTGAELAAFQLGQQHFMGPLPGFGPLFNEPTCLACHSIPTVGGGGDRSRAVFMGPGGGDVTLYRKHAMPGFQVPVRPDDVSQRIPPPLYGLGLIEQIPDDTIRAACGDGHVDLAKQQGAAPANQVARFGIKPFLGTVTDFVGNALLSESGVTNRVEGDADEDAAPDPEVDLAFVAALAAYVRGLPPPARDGNDAAGEAAFTAFGCAGCHRPDMPPAMGVYSNFCLHDMGAALADGIEDHEAQGDEFRTTPLWGLRFRREYLHDGRATTLEDAIALHGGQAADAAEAFQDAPPEQRAALLRFLNTL